MKVVVAMSGGVDSSIAAALMVEAGHEVIGMTMRLYDADPTTAKGRGGTCCSPAEVDLARAACARLGVPHYVVDERQRFAASVIDPFARDYAEGKTPNPCTRCNQYIKFGPLLARARALGAERLVTGHYARSEDRALLRGVDDHKDQSYFLFAMGAEALAATWFPLGSWTKDRVRAKAESLGMPNADAPDSQELCFVPHGDHGAVVEERLRAQGHDLEGLKPGLVVDAEGQVLGEHSGIHRVTVGQRRGLHLRGHERRYALRVIPETSTVVAGAAQDVGTSRFAVGELHRLGLVDGLHRVHVQVRHRGTPVPAEVQVGGEQAQVTVMGDPISVAPGQAAVFYDGPRVLGGGWILG